MNFYTSIAPYYDLLFPYDETQIKFLEAVLSPSLSRIDIRKGSANVSTRGYLDVGCGTGTILSAFTDQFHRLAGIDLDAELLKLAAEKMYPGEEERVELLEEDMLEIRTVFREETFSFITCLGNTIPHLAGERDVFLFFSTIFDCLDAGGVFVFQMINYDRILDGDIRGLDTIDRGKITFERQYSALKADGHIDFDTILNDEANDIIIKNSVELYPIRKGQAAAFLKKAGFSSTAFFGSFDGEPYVSDSLLLIGVCSK